MFDLVIAAGTPEWRGPHFQAVFRAAQSRPWLFLGIDHVHEEDISPTPEEIRIWTTAFIVTRGRLGTEALARIGVEAHTLPCPSLFAATWERPGRALNSIGVVLQNDRVLNQSIPSTLQAESIHLIHSLRKHYKVVVFCNYIDDFVQISEIPDVPVRYSYDSNEYLDMMSECDVIVSTRLHSALVANSLLKPAIVVSGSSRVLSATEQYPYVSVVEPRHVLQYLRQLDMDVTVRGLLNWKRSVETEYKELLIEQLRRYGLYSL